MITSSQKNSFAIYYDGCLVNSAYKVHFGICYEWLNGQWQNEV
jgi:hypothetical protein